MTADTLRLYARAKERAEKAEREVARLTEWIACLRYGVEIEGHRSEILRLFDAAQRGEKPPRP